MRRTTVSLVQELESIVDKSAGALSAPDFYAAQELILELKSYHEKYPSMELFKKYEDTVEGLQLDEEENE